MFIHFCLKKLKLIQNFFKMEHFFFMKCECKNYLYIYNIQRDIWELFFKTVLKIVFKNDFLVFFLKKNCVWKLNFKK